MSQSWFYRHAGQTHGPVSSEQVKELAKKGKLDPHDLIWPEGGDPQGAIPADAALDFSGVPPQPETPPAPAKTATTAERPPAVVAKTVAKAVAKVAGKSAAKSAAPAAGPVPDWLSDVAALETRGPQAPPARRDDADD